MEREYVTANLGAKANTMVMDAIMRSRQGLELKVEEKVLLAIADGKWHSGAELAEVTWRFGGYLHNLKQKGVCWEKRLMEGRPKGRMLYEYRAVKGE